MKPAHLFSILAVLAFGMRLAAADPPGRRDDFTGTYIATLPERAEILQLTATVPRRSPCRTR